MRLFHLLVFAALTCTSSLAQNRAKAERAVSAFLKASDQRYSPVGFGECFEQTSASEIQALMGTTGTVKYSVVHTYSLDGDKHVDEYFHLDADYQVLGHLSMQQMTDMTTRIILSNPGFLWMLDSLGVDTSKIERP